MKARQPVNVRKAALVQRLGFDPNEVIEDSFDEDGFEILGDKTAFGGALIIVRDELVRTRVWWPNREVAREALRARQDDFNETIGPEAAAAVADMAKWLVDTPKVGE